MVSAMQTCCTQILAACPYLQVAFPGTASYNATQHGYYSLQEALLSPSCIVTPKSAHDVADLVSVLAVNEDCNFAIKGQGHAPGAGFANIDHGVTIDMTSLSAITVNEDHSVASIGAGASWLDVYAFLDPLGKTVAGGRNGQVGVGGLTLGGGISYFSPQVGFTCDTVVNFEVALASGKLINANKTSNAALYRSLKGGGNNFGIVARMDFTTLPISEILGGFLANDISHRQAAFTAFMNIANATLYDVHASIVMSTGFNVSTKSWSLLSIPVYTLPDPKPPVYHELFAIPSTLNTLHITKLSILANESAPAVLNQAFYTGTYRVSTPLMNCMFDICNHSVYTADIPSFASMGLAFEPFPTVFAFRGENQNSLGTSASEGNAFIILLSPEWTDAKSNSAIARLTNGIIDEFDRVAQEMGLLIPFRYANYADVSQRPLRSYGEGNFEGLVKTSKKWDPKEVFQKRVPGGFKLRPGRPGGT